MPRPPAVWRLRPRLVGKREWSRSLGSRLIIAGEKKPRSSAPADAETGRDRPLLIRHGMHVSSSVWVLPRTVNSRRASRVGGSFHLT
jgi:hypothetical protein